MAQNITLAVIITICVLLLAVILLIVIPFPITVFLEKTEDEKAEIMLLLWGFFPIKPKIDMKQGVSVNPLKFITIKAAKVQIFLNPARKVRLLYGFAIFESLIYGVFSMLNAKFSTNLCLVSDKKSNFSAQVKIGIKVYVLIKELLWKKRVK